MARAAALLAAAGLLAPAAHADDAADLESVTDALALSPGSPAVLRAAATAALRAGRNHLALYYLDRLLLVQPGDPEAHRLRASAARDAGFPEDAVSGAGGDGFYASIYPYASVLGYGGDTLHARGRAFEADLRVGRWSRGYLDFAAAETDIEQRAPADDFGQREAKFGAGVFVTPTLLLRGRYDRVSLDSSDDRSDLLALGADYLRWPHLSLGVDLLAGDYPSTRTRAIAPQVTLRTGRFAFGATAKLQRATPDSAQASTRVYTEGRVDYAATPRATISLGLGGGCQTYPVGGAGDIVFNLPDRERRDAFFEVRREIGPLVARWRSAFQAFEDEVGEDYHAVVHTLSVGYAFGDGGPEAARGLAFESPGDSPWRFSAGVAATRLTLRTAEDPVAPLVRAVHAPVAYGSGKLYRGAAGRTYYNDGIVYYDPATTPVGGSGEAFFSVADASQVEAGTPYSTVHMASEVYSYRTRDSFVALASSDEADVAGPSIALHRTVAEGETAGAVRIGVRYAYGRAGRDGGRQVAARQMIYEDRRVTRFNYPVSLGSYIIYDPAAFAEAYPSAPVPPAPARSSSMHSRVYEDYTATTHTWFETGLHTVDFDVEWALQPARWLEAALSVGPSLALADWRIRRATEWDSSRRGVVLEPVDEVDSGLDAVWGFASSASVRIYPRPQDPVYIELAGRYQSLKALHAAAGFAHADMRLDDWSGMAGVGFDL